MNNALPQEAPTSVTNEAGLEPVGHFLVVRMEEAEETSAGGILLPQDVRDREEMSGIRATIIAIGPEAWSDKPSPWARVGDRVMISKFSGQLWKVGNTKYRYRVITDLSIAAIDHT